MHSLCELLCYFAIMSLRFGDDNMIGAAVLIRWDVARLDFRHRSSSVGNA